jgi:hypothetical protein
MTLSTAIRIILTAVFTIGGILSAIEDRDKLGWLEICLGAFFIGVLITVIWGVV